MAKEWEDTKRRLLFYEDEPDRQLSGAHPSHQMLVNAAFAHALRLIMERMEGMAPKCPKCGKPMVLKFYDTGIPPNRFGCDCEEENDPRYMLNQIERLTWEGHQLRMMLIANGADMDEVREMTNNEAWMATKKEGS